MKKRSLAIVALGALGIVMLASGDADAIITSTGPKRAKFSTYEGDVAAWARARLDWATDYLKRFWSSSLDAQGIKDVALSALAHWSLETNSGSGESNFNVGNIHAMGSEPWFRGPDMNVKGKKYQTSFAAYDSVDAGVVAYFSLLEKHYASCMQKLIASPADAEWFKCLGRSGYYAATMKGKDNIEPAAKGWAARRALLAQYATEG